MPLCIYIYLKKEYGDLIFINSNAKPMKATKEKSSLRLNIRKTVGLALATLATVAMALVISGSGKSSVCNSCSHGMSLNNSNKLINFEVI